MIRRQVSVWLIGSVAWLSCGAAACHAYVWFGPQDGLNGVRIVCREMNRDRVTISPGTNAILAAVQLVDDNMSYDVTDTAQWSGLCVVPRGPYRGYVLASHTGTFTLAVAHTAGGKTFRDSIALSVTMPNDADNDGMLDAWEEAHGVDTGRNDAAEDKDGDGVSNLHEFWNGTDPGVWQEVFAFPPLHRYPYSNGCYCAPDVNLEWFASTTLGRYDVEAAVWPGCEKLVYRGSVWNTNSIGDAIVHTADLSGAMGTQVAFRVRAAFTNEDGWTAWSAWRPFTVLEPLDDHTLRLANGEPLRGMYFFYWNYTLNKLTNDWRQRGYYEIYSSNYMAACEQWLRMRDAAGDLDWGMDDTLCTSELAVVKHAGYNTLFLDQQAFKIARSGTIYDVNQHRYVFNTNAWPASLDRENTLTRLSGLQQIPWLSYSFWGGFNPPQGGYAHDANFHHMSWRYLGRPSDHGILTSSVRRIVLQNGDVVYATRLGNQCLPDPHHPDYQAMWAGFVNEYVARYDTNTNSALNALAQVQFRGATMPIVAMFVELQPMDILDFGARAQAEFRAWLLRRYGTVAQVNRAWRTDFSEVNAINPVAQEGTIFQWSTRDAAMARPASDYLEYGLERFVDGWRAIKEKIQERVKVVLAVEFMAPLGYTAGAGHVPYYRVAEWADVIIQRHGFDYCWESDRVRYTRHHKSGKSCVFSGMGVGHWQYYVLNARVSGDNVGTYSWNELCDLTGIVMRENGSTDAGKLISAAHAASLSCIGNSSCEGGTARVVPGWTFDSGIGSVCATRSYTGKAAIRFEGPGSGRIVSDPVMCQAHAVYLFSITVRAECPTGVGAGEIAVQIGEKSFRYTFDQDGWRGDEDALANPHAAVWDVPEYAELSKASTERISAASLQQNEWMTFVTLVSGSNVTQFSQLQIDVSVPSNTIVCIDCVNLSPLE